MSTVLVTGGAGYIGSHTVLALREANYQVVVLDDLSTGSQQLVPTDVQLIIGDTGNSGLLKDLFQQYQFTAVLHFAGSIVVSESVKNPLHYYQNNTCNSINLIDACVRFGNKPAFIFSSTAAVYGAPESTPILETATLKPINPYGWSKYMIERILINAAHAHHFNYAILRYFNVAGADKLGRAGQPSKQVTHLIKIAAQVAVGSRDHIEIYGNDYPTPDGTCIRDYVHVSDLANAHVKALTHIVNTKSNGTWNCGYGKGFSVQEILATVEKNIGKKLNKTVTNRRDGDPPILIANADRLKIDTGWKPVHNDINEIVSSAIAWERKLQ